MLLAFIPFPNLSVSGSREKFAFLSTYLGTVDLLAKTFVELLVDQHTVHLHYWSTFHWVI